MNQQEGIPKTSRKAIACLVMGLLSVVVSPCAILALVFGHKARREVKNRPHELKGLKLANTGLIVSYFVLGFLTLLFLIVVVPVIPKSYKASHTLAVLEQIRNLQAALDKYADDRDGSYPESLASLTESSWTPSERFFTGISGYHFSYQPRERRIDPQTGRPLVVSYELRADPRGILMLIPGAYYFYVDETRVIRYHVGRPADRSSPPLR